MRFITASLTLIAIVTLKVLFDTSRSNSPSHISVIERGASSPTNHAPRPHSSTLPDSNFTGSTARPRADYQRVGENIGEPKDPDDPAYWPQTNYDDLSESIGESKDPDDPAYWPQTNYDDLGENIGEPIDPDDPASWPQTNYEEPGENIGQPIDPDDPDSWP